MAEEWIRWEPMPHISEKYLLDLVVDTYQEFRLTLSFVENRKKKINIFFEEGVRAYRFTKKDAWLKSNIHIFSHKDKPNWTFFKVSNSHYLRWIAESTCGIYPQGYTHFSFVTTNVVVDVLNFDEPKIEIIED